MGKFVWFVLLLIVVSAAVGESILEKDDDKGGPCGKFSTERMLTHKLRHCEKAARSVNAPVSAQCCKDLARVSIPCLYAVFSSDAFHKVGINPHVAITIPSRCHHIHD